MRIDFVVLGATGMQGRIVSRDLLENGYSVLMCGRDRLRLAHLLKKYSKSHYTYVEAREFYQMYRTIKSEIAIDDIVFKLAPRINAAGRMDDAKNAVRLLIGDSTFHHAEKLQKNNEDRKMVDSDMTQQALEMLRNNPELQSKKTTVLFNPSWHKGVVGIVASRLIDDFYRPTVILTESNGMLTGSARSIS